MKKQLLFVFAFAFASALSLGAQARDPVTNYRDAQILYAEGNYYHAIDELLAATVSNPAYADAWALLAFCHYELHEYERALEFTKKAALYGPKTSDLLNLEGLCHIAMGRLDDARTSFETVIQKLPNDRDARFGLALLDIRAGRPVDARRRLTDSLKLSPRDPRALLSLALISREEGKIAESDSYLSEALKWNAGDAQVSYAAALMAAEGGRMDDAARLCALALEEQPGHLPAMGLLANIHYEKGNLDTARAILEQALLINNRDVQIWYLIGLVEAAAKSFTEAEYALSQIARLRPDDELARLAVEQLVMDMTGLEDPIRREYSEWRYRKARELENSYLYERAIGEYRRALALDPYSNKTRRAYAELLRVSGLHSMYFDELAFLRDIGKADTPLEDALDAYSSFIQDTVANSWKADRLAIAEKPWNVMVLSLGPGGLPWHAGSDLIVARYLRDQLTSSPQLNLARQVARVGDFSDAFRKAREASMDWFLLIQFMESERDVLLTVELRSARSGALVMRTEAARSGNDRLALTVTRILSWVKGGIPLKGKILERRGDLALADFGKMDGVAKGDEFLVIRSGGLSIKADGSGLSWDEKDVLASFTVTRVDDEVSEGNLFRNGFFDRSNPGDILVRKPQDIDEKANQGGSLSGVFNVWANIFERIRALY